MALVIEDGSIVSDANSYISVANARTYAEARGTEFPTSDTEVEVLLIKAMDYLEMLDYQGSIVEEDQPLSWPRKNVVIDEYAKPNNFIPLQLINAQVLLAVEAMSTDLMPSSDGKEVLKDKVDVIETQYAKSGNSNQQPVFTQVEALLRKLLSKGTLHDFSLTAVRV